MFASLMLTGVGVLFAAYILDDPNDSKEVKAEQGLMLAVIAFVCVILIFSDWYSSF